MNKRVPLALGSLGSTGSALPSFEPLDRSTLQNQAYELLRKAIMGGVFKPGTVLTIRAAADALGTSPMPVRGALQRLEVEGALVAKGPKRTLEIPEMSKEEYIELRDIGMLLEGLAAETAASRITAEELVDVRRACADMQAAAEAGDLDAYVTANWAFHGGIYQASRMETLMGYIEKRWLRIGPYVRYMMPDKASLIESMPSHWTALQALEAGDAQGARKAIATDLYDCAVTLIEFLKPKEA